MKTTSNAPKIRLGQVMKVIVRSSSVITCLVLISGSVSAQDFWKHFQSENNNDQWITSSVERTSETAKTYKYIQTFEAAPMLDMDVLVNNSEYKPEEFVAVEMAGEAENLKNSSVETSAETIEAESALQIDLLMNYIKFDVNKFVEADRTAELETLNSEDNFIQTAETITASECNQHIERYARNQILLQENRTSVQIAEAQAGN